MSLKTELPIICLFLKHVIKTSWKIALIIPGWALFFLTFWFVGPLLLWYITWKTAHLTWLQKTAGIPHEKPQLPEPYDLCAGRFDDEFKGGLAISVIANVAFLAVIAVIIKLGK